jgi:hypothetical protein
VDGSLIAGGTISWHASGFNSRWLDFGKNMVISRKFGR